TERIGSTEIVDVRVLAGGVSNIVLYVSRDTGGDFVLKQAREQLRVPDPWFCSVERIWREVAVMRLCGEILADVAHADLQIQPPDVLFEDRENFVFAMSAAPAHQVWKQQLLTGVYQQKIAQACGRMLGRLHNATWHDDAAAKEFADQQFFVDLRVDPYYRHIASVHEDLRPAIDRLADSVQHERHCLVHGDFSPKNLLVWQSGVMLIDFEVGHYGDPAFDLGFLLAHLVLKAFHAAPDFEPMLSLIDAFWESYLAELVSLSSNERLELETRTVINFAACALARVDGKSKVEYLRTTHQAMVRKMCRQILFDAPEKWADAEVQIRTALRSD
ncbi:MAG: phosphotransferase, partial [Planctomycetes bacterium]|nr:phosphotransferase [Planctomycetota bacterium]